MDGPRDPGAPDDDQDQDEGQGDEVTSGLPPEGDDPMDGAAPSS